MVPQGENATDSRMCEDMYLIAKARKSRRDYKSKTLHEKSKLQAERPTIYTTFFTPSSADKQTSEVTTPKKDTELRETQAPKTTITQLSNRTILWV